MDKHEELLRSVLNNLSVFKQEVLLEIKKLKKEMRENYESLTDRMDKFGNQLAYLEDDTPTRDEFDKLEKRVSKVEKKNFLTSN